jgi:hypothetical protein
MNYLAFPEHQSQFDLRTSCDHYASALDVDDCMNINSLSQRAIELAYHSASTSQSELSARMYYYNRVPLSMRWMQQFGNEQAVLGFLGLNSDGTWQDMDIGITVVDRKRSLHGEISQATAWRLWRIADAPEFDAMSQPTYKLYVSPVLTDLPEVFGFVRGTLRHSGALMAKIGRNLPGLLRPDKLMIYFSGLAEALAYGRHLRVSLTTERAHGVPFTFQIGHTPLVSLGVDPPRNLQKYQAANRSWRIVVTRYLAWAILRTRQIDPDDPLPMIHDLMQQNGIDPSLWVPTGSRWCFPL